MPIGTLTQEIRIANDAESQLHAADKGHHPKRGRHGNTASPLLIQRFIMVPRPELKVDSDPIKRRPNKVDEQYSECIFGEFCRPLAVPYDGSKGVEEPHIDTRQHIQRLSAVEQHQRELRVIEITNFMRQNGCQFDENSAEQ